MYNFNTQSMNHKPSIPILSGLRRAFLGLRSLDDLYELLQTEELKLSTLALNPRYNVFQVPKKSGKMRLIEDPYDDLQAVQATLNDYLQAVYWFQRSPAAYGFVINPPDGDTPRHIESNATRHLNRPWLLNCDLLDFFHQVSTERVKNVFAGPPFHYDPDVSELLAGLCTFKRRCPMGAPTSPVLSNFAFSAADADLLELAARRGWHYSRYADDMSFSSLEPMSWDDYTDIKRVVTDKHGFEFNEEKAGLFGPEDVKTITGLLLTPDGVEVPPDFVPKLIDDIRQLESALKVQFRAGYGRPSRTNERFQRSVEGKLAFYRRIMGAAHPSMRPIEKALAQALAPPEALEVYSWLDFDYF